MRPAHEDLRCAGLRFFGAVSASATHELKNAFAIVRELSGLLGDLAAAGSETSVTVTDFSLSRVADISERIGRQVARADAIVRRMNAFSHSVDRVRAAVDLGELLELLAGLCRRFADMARVALSVSGPEEPLSVVGDAFLLQHALYLPLRRAIAGAGEGATVTIAAAAAEGGARITIDGRRESPPAEEGPILAALVRRLGATATEDGDRFELRVPARAPEREENRE